MNTNMYGQGFGYSQPNYNQPAPPRHTNVILVTGPDEAVMRTPNDADMLYIDQNKPVMYRVVSDMFGRKSLAEYPYLVPNAEQDTPVLLNGSSGEHIATLHEGELDNAEFSEYNALVEKIKADASSIMAN